MQLNSVQQPKPLTLLPTKVVQYTINLSPRAYMEVIQARFIDLKLFPARMKTDIEFYDITDQSIEFVTAVMYGNGRYGLIAIEGKVTQDSIGSILELKKYNLTAPQSILGLIFFFPLAVVATNYHYKIILLSICLLSLGVIWVNSKRLHRLIQQLT